MTSKAAIIAHANLDLAEAVGSFTRHLRAENIAPSTVATNVKALHDFKSSSRIENGGTADALRNEVRTGRPTRGKSHLQKSQDTIRELDKAIKSGRLRPDEVLIARFLRRDLAFAVSSH